MSEELNRALHSALARMLVLAADDAEFKAQLRLLAQTALAWVETLESPAADQGSSEQVERSVSALAAVEQTSSTLAQTDDLLIQGAAGLIPTEGTPPAWPARWMPTTDDDLQAIEARCRLKSEGSRWQAERQRRARKWADHKSEIEPKDRDIVSRAKSLTDCFLWMNHPSGPSPADLTLWDELASCFEVTADVVALVRSVLETPANYQDVFEQALDLLAEAQSALRIAVGHVDGQVDSDQAKVFSWLKRTAAEQQIFLQRHMRIDDPADAGNWSALAARIHGLDDRLQGDRKRNKERTRLLGKVRYEVKQLTNDLHSELDPHWRTLIKTVDELVQEGLPASNRELRELLLPISERVPDLELPPSFETVLGEIGRYLESRPIEEREAAREHSDQVREAARLLRGRTVVVIGGTRYPHSEAALESALGVKINWIATREHESTDGFEPEIARPEVELVLLLIRWSSHSYGDVKRLCDRYGKLFVRLPAGLSPNQVATKILEQCGERLAERAAVQ